MNTIVKAYETIRLPYVHGSVSSWCPEDALAETARACEIAAWQMPQSHGPCVKSRFTSPLKCVCAHM